MKSPLLLLATVLCFLGPLAQAQNLVVNPGFETGNFSGWTVTPAPALSNVSVGSTNPGAGAFGAEFRGATTADPDRVSQAVSTVAGQLYTFSFFVRIEAVFAGGMPFNSFRAFFDGMQVYSVVNSNSGFTTLTFTNLLATTNSTVIEFRGSQFGGYTVLDTVSVVGAPGGSTAVPENGNSLALLGGSAGLLALLSFRRRAPACKAI